MSETPAPAVPPAAPPAASPPPPHQPDYSLRGYVLEAMHVLTDIDSRLVSSFRSLVTRPGALAVAYFSAARERYLRPLRIFLYCNVIYFLAQPFTNYNTLTSPLQVHLYALPYSRWVRPMVIRRVQHRHVRLVDYAVPFDATVQAHARTLAIALVPILALVLAVVLFRRRRYFVEHMVFATHSIALFILLMPLLQLVLTVLWRVLPAAGMGAYSVNLLLEAGSIVLPCGAYFYFGLRRFYSTGRVAGAVYGLLLGMGMIFVIQAYRFVLFVTTYWTT